MSINMACGDPMDYGIRISTQHIEMGAPFKSVQLLDQITGEIYELVVRDGKMELLATSKQGIRQQKIESVIKQDE